MWTQAQSRASNVPMMSTSPLMPVCIKGLAVATPLLDNVRLSNYNYCHGRHGPGTVKAMIQYSVLLMCPGSWS